MPTRPRRHCDRRSCSVEQFRCSGLRGAWPKGHRPSALPRPGGLGRRCATPHPSSAAGVCPPAALSPAAAPAGTSSPTLAYGEGARLGASRCALGRRRPHSRRRRLRPAGGPVGPAPHRTSSAAGMVPPRCPAALARCGTSAPAWIVPARCPARPSPRRTSSAASIVPPRCPGCASPAQPSSVYGVGAQLASDRAEPV